MYPSRYANSAWFKSALASGGASKPDSTKCSLPAEWSPCSSSECIWLGPNSLFIYVFSRSRSGSRLASFTAQLTMMLFIAVIQRTVSLYKLFYKTSRLLNDPYFNYIYCNAVTHCNWLEQSVCLSRQCPDHMAFIYTTFNHEFRNAFKNMVLL